MKRRWSSSLGSLGEALLDLCFPPRCLGCGVLLPAPGRFFFCLCCGENLVPIREPICTCCGRMLRSAAGGNRLCGLCLAGNRHFDLARALFLYKGPLLPPLHAFKYLGDRSCLSSFAAAMERWPFGADLGEIDWLLPVPLAAGRLRERGFNQALELARALFPAWRARIRIDLLRRVGERPPQTSLAGAARRRNVKGVFEAEASESLRGKTVLLVDDVYTTGATVSECARVLRRAGAGMVRVFTLARVEE